ncbi:MAG: MucR family transcriptional regulator [Rhodospirillales bacterium]|nr:MucR family transcriptional regulator [Rhodospirillales bacterium]MDE0378400.1 MucR family transcriptional regulator [Rhodospirillales bacterium]
MSDETENPGSNDALLRMTADVVTAYVGNNTVAPTELADVIRTVHASLRQAQASETAVSAAPKPAVPVKKSITPDYLICLEDGRELKMLKRHLRTTYNMTPDEYRAKWGLDPDYPMVAPNYARRRSEFAKQIGLGQKRRRAGAAEGDDGAGAGESSAPSTGSGAAQ